MCEHRGGSRPHLCPAQPIRHAARNELTTGTRPKARPALRGRGEPGAAAPDMGRGPSGAPPTQEAHLARATASCPLSLCDRESGGVGDQPGQSTHPCAHHPAVWPPNGAPLRKAGATKWSWPGGPQHLIEPIVSNREWACNAVEGIRCEGHCRPGSNAVAARGRANSSPNELQSISKINQECCVVDGRCSAVPARRGSVQGFGVHR